MVLICICFILFQSAIPESKSAHASQWFTEHVLNPFLQRIGITADKDIVRKVAHAVEFCILSQVLFIWWKKPIRTFYAGIFG